MSSTVLSFETPPSILKVALKAYDGDFGILVSQFGGPDVIDTDSSNLAVWAAYAGNLPMVKYMAQNYPYLLALPDDKGRTALLWACNEAHWEVIKFLASFEPKMLGPSVTKAGNSACMVLLGKLKKNLEGLGEDGVFAYYYEAGLFEIVKNLLIVTAQNSGQVGKQASLSLYLLAFEFWKQYRIWEILSFLLVLQPWQEGDFKDALLAEFLKRSKFSAKGADKGEDVSTVSSLLDSSSGYLSFKLQTNYSAWENEHKKAEKEWVLNVSALSIKAEVERPVLEAEGLVEVALRSPSAVAIEL